MRIEWTKNAVIGLRHYLEFNIYIFIYLFIFIYYIYYIYIYHIVYVIYIIYLFIYVYYIFYIYWNFLIQLQRQISMIFMFFTTCINYILCRLFMFAPFSNWLYMTIFNIYRLFNICIYNFEYQFSLFTDCFMQYFHRFR